MPGRFCSDGFADCWDIVGAAGSSVTIPVAFSSGSTGVSTLQFDLTYSSSLSCVTPSSDITTGSAATAAGKSATGSAITGGVRVIIYGMNVNTIGSGVVANVLVKSHPAHRLDQLRLR